MQYRHLADKTAMAVIGIVRVKQWSIEIPFTPGDLNLSFIQSKFIWMEIQILFYKRQ